MSKKIVQVIIIVIVILSVAGVWVIKNKEEIFNADTSNENNNAIIGLGNFTEKELADFDINITEDFNLEELKEYNLPIILYFWADYCPSCISMFPTIESLSEEVKGKAIIKAINTEEYPEIANEYPFYYIPTQIFFNSDGTAYAPSESNKWSMQYYADNTDTHVLTTHSGILSEEDLKTILKEMGMDE